MIKRPELARRFGIDLMEEFIRWIDRGEKTTKTYLINLHQFWVWTLYAGVPFPQREDIIAYRDWLSGEHDAIRQAKNNSSGWEYRRGPNGETVRITCKPNTVAQYLRSVCQFFRWTAAQGYYPDIAANVHAPKLAHTVHRKEALNPSDVLAIENSILKNTETAVKAAANAVRDRSGKLQRSEEQGLRLNAMYQLAVNAGLRTIELSRANIRDLETRGGKVWLYIWGKGHTEPDQKKPIAPQVFQAISRYLQSRTDHPSANSPLFVATGNRSRGKRLDPCAISRMLKKAMVDAGYNSERLTAHSLRHTAGTSVMEVTQHNIYSTQQYMRHSSPTTTEIYLHTDNEKAELDISQKLYDLYHRDQGDCSERAHLEEAIKHMTPEQLEQLAQIAAAISR